MGLLETLRRGLWERHEQAEGGGVLEQYLTVQRLYPNQEMSCIRAAVAEQDLGKGGGGRWVAQIITHAHPIDLPGW